MQPLCKRHHQEMHSAKLSAEDLSDSYTFKSTFARSADTETRDV